MADEPIAGCTRNRTSYKRGCRCPFCTGVNRDYMRSYLARMVALRETLPRVHHSRSARGRVGRTFVDAAARRAEMPSGTMPQTAKPGG